MDENKRILIVDDNTDIHKDFHKILSPATETEDSLSLLHAALFNEPVVEHEPKPEGLKYELDDAYQGEEAIELVEKAMSEERPYAVIFMDVRMPPGMNGIETIYRIWRKYPFIEMVICTAYSDYSWDEIIDKLGKTDKLLFLKKPFNIVEVQQMALSLIKKSNLNNQLNQLINNLEQEVKDRTTQLNKVLVELREKNRVLSEIAQRDGLTGLLNHLALYDRLSSIYNESRRHNFPISIVMLDVDHFKEFNDTYGHQVGDEILMNVAVILKNSLRLYDIKVRMGKSQNEEEINNTIENFNIAGRYGGDEFILLLPYCSMDGAVSLAGRISRQINQIKLKDTVFEKKLTVSIGVSTLPEDKKCIESRELIKLADKALYRSKENGRDQINFIEVE